MNALQVSRRRCGEQNARTKLSDENVVLMRRFRCEWAKTPKYRELAGLFGVNEKYAQLICTGAARTEAGGPIENGHKKVKQGEERDEVELDHVGYDLRVVIVCEACRGRYHPSVENPKRCLRCHLYGSPD